MTPPAPTYDLVLLLDPQAQESARAKIVADTRATIEGQGELLRHDEWGERPLAYPIERRTSAEYHLLQFHANAAELLSELPRTLRITDGVLRFRLIKLARGVPDAPDMRSSASGARRPEGERPESAPRAEGEPAVAAAAEPA
ncbi:MAG TPA: 30S ribosomal protein S6 [Solirubrobacteraceae bacterium]|nr:30S ribosomal protein S6 [Solirubrobacteraceae bacterium]